MSSRALRAAMQVLDAPEGEFEDFARKAERITMANFGQSRTLFNPIYLSNVCSNDCPYCGYRRSNHSICRRTLTPEQAVIEATFLRQRGVRSILLLAGEFTRDPYLRVILDCASAIRRYVKPGWLGIEVAPMNEDAYRALRDAGIDSVVVFQETYNRQRYEEVHGEVGPKGDFDNRLNALDRAATAGIGELGLGVLYGIGNYREDTLSMVRHAIDLKRRFRNCKLRFSFPRLQPSFGQDDSVTAMPISEKELFLVIVSIRVAFPDASLVLTGRESSDFLLRAAGIVDILGKGGSTTVGGYVVGKAAAFKLGEQFRLNDDLEFNQFRTLMINNGYSLS